MFNEQNVLSRPVKSKPAASQDFQPLGKCPFQLRAIPLFRWLFKAARSSVYQQTEIKTRASTETYAFFCLKERSLRIRGRNPSSLECAYISNCLRKVLVNFPCVKCETEFELKSVYLSLLSKDYSEELCSAKFETTQKTASSGPFVVTVVDVRVNFQSVSAVVLAT
ncbi:hypothetical protein BaRGS_00007796 [Batillaria attramentaria]|uniref:Uncharacterized protein n=1 Tax=Batillaria attramentaria TaxID=370345 RepID=A0ABD0LNV4_9CAEN